MSNENPGEGHTPVTFCHKPGTPAAQELTTDDDGFLQGHLNHGDSLGACPVTEPTYLYKSEPYFDCGLSEVTHTQFVSTDDGVTWTATGATLIEPMTEAESLEHCDQPEPTPTPEPTPIPTPEPTPVDPVIICQDGTMFPGLPEDYFPYDPCYVEPTPTAPPTIGTPEFPTETTTDVVVPASKPEELAATGPEGIVLLIALGAALLASGITATLKGRKNRG